MEINLGELAAIYTRARCTALSTGGSKVKIISLFFEFENTGEIAVEIDRKTAKRLVCELNKLLVVEKI